MHAEIDCIRKASEVLSTWRLSECTLYSTLEPCPMCMGAILNSRIKTLVYGASDSRIGACKSNYNIPATYPMHSMEVIAGVLADESATLLKNFFKSRRLENTEVRNNSKLLSQGGSDSTTTIASHSDESLHSHQSNLTTSNNNSNSNSDVRSKQVSTLDVDRGVEYHSI